MKIEFKERESTEILSINRFFAFKKKSNPSNQTNKQTQPKNNIKTETPNPKQDNFKSG